MKKLLFLFIFPLLLSSCATIFLDKTHVLNIQSDLSNSKVKVNDSIYTLPANVEVKRSNQDLHLTLLTNSKEIPFKAKRRLTWNFKYGNLYWIYFYYFPPIGYVVDLTNHKRFYYGKSLWLNSTAKDSAVTVLKEQDPRYKYVDSLAYYKHYIFKKGDFRINLTGSYPNILNLKPGNQITASFADAVGLSFGADYFHRKDQFINATYTKITTQLMTAVLTGMLTGVYQQMDSDYFRVTNNHTINRFSLGYGLSYGTNHFLKTSFYFYKPDYINKRYSVFGLSFPAYYQAGKCLYLGLVYNPSFFRTNQSTQWAYEHLISFDFAWKIRL